MNMQQMTLGNNVLDIVPEAEVQRSNFTDLDFDVRIEKGTIKSNSEDLKKYVQSQMSVYDTRTYDGEDAIKKMKKDRADLNELVKKVENRRKEIKKEYMKPVTLFETEVKNLVSYIDKPIATLNDKISAAEEDLKAQVRKKIQKFYVDYVQTTPLINELKYRNTLFRQIYDSKWENVSTTQKTWKTAIVNAVDQYLESKKTLDAMNEPDFYDEALKILQDTGKCEAAVSYISGKVAERQERERIRLEAEAKAKAKYEEALKKKEEEAAKQAKLQEERFHKEQKKKIEELKKREAELKEKASKPIRCASQGTIPAAKQKSSVSDPGMVTFSIPKKDAKKVEQYLFMNDISYKIGC